MNNSIFKDKRVIIVIVVFIILLLIYFVFYSNIFKNHYTKLEEDMVTKAKSYLLNNNLSLNKELYLDVNKLGIDIDDNCSITSGVFYNNGNYQPYLACDDYKTKVITSNDSVKDNITLLGDEVIVLAKDVNYVEPGYKSNTKVTISGEILNEEGVYYLYYRPENSQGSVIRKVAVVDSSAIRNLYPKIELVGNSNIYLVQGESYQELGVKAYEDSKDISSNVIINGNVDVNLIGKYELDYQITNSQGFSNSVKRNVYVIDKNSDLIIDYTITPSDNTNKDVSIEFTTSGEYKKVVYPNGEEGTSLIYQVTENGEYEFAFYDEYNRVVTKNVKITNIDKILPLASCEAILSYNKTEIKVTNSNKEISEYQYILDNNSTTSKNNTFTSSVVKPSIVKIKIKDAVGNENEINCSKKEDYARKVVTNAKGKNCLEGYTCYVQFDYNNATKYPFCSSSNNPNSCGGIGKNGCSLTSAANAIASFGLKSSNGTLYTPYTVWDELYPIDKKTGQCGGGCSAWSRIRDAIVNAGLTAPKTVTTLKSSTISMITDHLKKGYPVIVWAKEKPFASGTAHYMTLIGINENGYVFLSDSANTKGTKKDNYSGKQYYVDTWISTSDLITGNIKEFLLVGPKGMFEGK